MEGGMEENTNEWIKKNKNATDANRWKMQQEGSTHDRKNQENQSPGIKKSKKMGTRGASKRQQNAKLKKIGVVPKSFPPFLPIFGKNGSQDGGPNPPKIDWKINVKFNAFLIGLWMHFGRDLGAKMREKTDAKTVSKTRCNRSWSKSSENTKTDTPRKVFNTFSNSVGSQLH